MAGVHEDREGTSDFLYMVYRLGNIVRRGDTWGVVTESGRNNYHSTPKISWLTEGAWLPPVSSVSDNISAPYAHTYQGIPDEVLAKATEIMLRGEA
jgi:hypothetical protein